MRRRYRIPSGSVLARYILFKSLFFAMFTDSFGGGLGFLNPEELLPGL